MTKPRTLLLVAPRHDFNNLWTLKELGDAFRAAGSYVVMGGP